MDPTSDSGALRSQIPTDSNSTEHNERPLPTSPQSEGVFSETNSVPIVNSMTSDSGPSSDWISPRQETPPEKELPPAQELSASQLESNKESRALAGSRHSSHPPTTSSLIASTFLSLLVVLVLLAALRFLLPTTLELSRYSWFKGQLKAEYESSGEQLKQVSLESLSHISQTVARRVVPSVVHITTSSEEGPLNGVLGRRSMTGHGSGVIVDASGLILTNNHVLEDGPVIQVLLADERYCLAEKLGSDPFTDLAVLKIKADGLLPVTWGDSDKAELGSPVWAVGSPFGLTGSLTFGIVSSKHRLDLSGTQYDNPSFRDRSGKEKRGPTARYSDLMQTDVAVNPGNSGGPLVNGRGELIGINTAIIGESYRGVSFAIPSNLAKQIYEEIVKSGRMRRGWLGVEFVSAARWERMNSEDLILEPSKELTRDRRGAVISRILEGSPAEKGGLMVGDCVISVNDVAIKGVEDVIFRIGNNQPGSNLKLELERDGNTQCITVTIGQRPD